MQTLMPVLQQVFDMPGDTSLLKRGSSEWIQSVIKEQRFLYADCVRFTPLMKACVKFFLKAGDAKGYPIIQPGEKIPKNDIYIVNPHRVVKPRATTCQKELPFLRASSFQSAVLACKNACLYPVQVSNALWFS